MFNLWGRIISCGPVSNRRRLKIGLQNLVLPHFFLTVAAIASAQRLDPVKWSLTVEPTTAAPASKILGRLTATIEPGWHLYSLSTPPPSRPTKFQLADGPIFEGL